MDNQAQSLIEGLIGQYGWLFLAGVVTLIFQNTIREAVDGIMVFLGNDYNEDDVVEVDGAPGRIVRVGMWKTVFFIYHVFNSLCYFIFFRTGHYLVLDRYAINPLNI